MCFEFGPVPTAYRTSKQAVNGSIPQAWPVSFNAVMIVITNAFISSLTHYQMTNFRLLKLKEFADDNFKFDENSRKSSKWVENTAGKGEIARYEQFLLLPQCFQKACFPGASKGVIVWEWIKADHYFDGGNVGKQSVVWKDYFEEY